MQCEYQAPWPQQSPRGVHELLEGQIMWWFCVCYRHITAAAWAESLPVPRVACWWSPCENSKKAAEHRSRKSLTFLLVQSCALALLITSLCIKHHRAPVHPGVKATMLWGGVAKDEWGLNSALSIKLAVVLSARQHLTSRTSLWIWNKEAAHFYHIEMNKG